MKKKDITKTLIEEISMELNDTIEVGIEETPNCFPYTKAFISFLEVLNTYGISKDINVLSEDIRDKICYEFSKYLGD